VSNSAVITGCGWVTPFGAGAARAFRAARSQPAGHLTVPAEFLNGGPALPEDLATELAVRLGARAVQLACEEAQLPLESLAGERTGLVIGSGLAGQGGMIDFANEVREQSARFVSPIHFPQTVGNYPAGAIGRAFHIRGVNTTISCGAAAGLEAVAEGARQIAADAADVMIVGGLEVFSDALARALEKDHEGLSDSACFFVVESAERASSRGIKPLAIWRGLRRMPTASANDVHDPMILSSAGCAVSGAHDVVRDFGWGLAASGAQALAYLLVSPAGPRSCAAAAGDGEWFAMAEIEFRT
jgi:3-oxoacyl-(acyl-carrier-protein) synthase